MNAMCGLSETFRPWCYLTHAPCGLAPTPTDAPLMVCQLRHRHSRRRRRHLEPSTDIDMWEEKS